MNERQMQFRVGVVVFATMIIGGLLGTLNAPLPTGWLPWGRHTYEVGIKVDKAPGVDQNTPVRKNGILIGRLKSIEEQPDGMLLRAEINANRPLYAEYEPHIRTTVIGDATIDFEFDFKHKRLPENAQPVPDGHVFQGMADESPFDAIAKFSDLKQDFAEAAHSLDTAGKEVAKLAARLNDTLGDENKEGRLNHLVETTDRAMKQFENTMTAFNEIFGDVPAAPIRTGVARPPLEGRPQLDGQAPPNAPAPLNSQPVPLNVQPQLNTVPADGVSSPIEGPEMRRRLREGLNELPDAIREMRVTLQDFRVVLQSANKNLRNLEGLTEPLGQKGGDIAGALLKVVDGLDQLVTDFNKLTTALNTRQGTIGKLLYDEQVYENLNRLMFNFNKVLGDIDDLAFRLKPVVNDARIFMDKIATEPGRLIGGSLKPSNIK